MSWFSSAINWIGDQVSSAWKWVSDPSGIPLNYFATMATVYQSPTIGNARYFIPRNPDRDVNAVMSGSKWASLTVSYSMPDSRSDYEWINPSASGYNRLSFETEQAFHFILKGYSPNGGAGMRMTSVESVANLSLTYAGRNNADIKLAGFNPGNIINRSHGYYPGVPVYGGDLWLENGDRVPLVGSYRYYQLLHELGHVLGLKHTHDQGANVPRMSAAHDSVEYSVMSYNYQDFPQTYMMYDIAALQDMYGANFGTNSGNTVYKWKPSTGETFVNGEGQGKTGLYNRIFLTIWDGGGIDTYDLSEYGSNLVIDLNPGGYSLFSSTQQARGAKGNVYNALQYKGDPRSLIENATTGTGNDTITGNKANNVLIGNAGNDTISGHDGNDTLYGGVGNDKLWGGLNNDVLKGEAGNDFLGGEAGDDLLSGGAGQDSLWGGWGADVLYGDDGNDFLAGEGDHDLLVGGAGEDSVYGGAGNDRLLGDDGNDLLYGETGNDELNGGAGIDSLYGGDGDDQLLGGAGFDLLDGCGGTDTANYGFDTGPSGVIVDLAAGRTWNDGYGSQDTLVGIENVVGSSRDDSLTGDANANAMDGQAGNDQMRGGFGNDWLYGNAGNDWIAGEGGDDIVTGGDGDDVVGGQDGNDRVLGDAGNDQVYGGTGNDTLEGGEGQDWLNGDEDWSATGGADSIYGGLGNDVALGGAGNDTIDGGLGNDELWGGVGADRFRFSTDLHGLYNVDRIQDFDVAEDKIELDGRIFKSLYTNYDRTLMNSCFKVGASATSVYDRIIYNSTTGELFYDADGSGVGVQVKFAELSKGLALTASNFVLA